MLPWERPGRAWTGTRTDARAPAGMRGDAKAPSPPKLRAACQLRLLVVASSLAWGSAAIAAVAPPTSMVAARRVMIVFMCSLHCFYDRGIGSPVIGWSNPDDRKDRICRAEISSDACADRHRCVSAW